MKLTNLKHGMPVQTYCFLLCAALLTACGGGGSGSGAASPSSGVSGDGSTTTPVIAGPTVITPPVLASGSLWSDAATWGGAKPSAGSNVIIPAGKQVVIDENTPALGELTIEGELLFKPGATAELSADVIKVQRGGALRAGSASAPFTGLAIITLRSADIAASSTGMGTRGILVDTGGKLELFGTAPAVPWTKLNAHADAGSKALTLAQNVGDWKAGDQIVIAPTEWYGTPWVTQEVHDASTATQKLNVASVSGASINTSSGVNAFRWGLLQYATDNGMSLTRGTFTKPNPNVPDTLDERAEVGNLTRNIVIQAPDDAAWRNSGFGAQVMIMNRSSSLQMDGVELRRMGQQGIVGRYPIHWHLLSYAANGSSLGDPVNHFVRNSTIADSKHRCMVIHGTNAITLQNNICYNIKGHAIFLEDAVEQRNVIEGNLVLRVRSPVDSLSTTAHEKSSNTNSCGASAGYWLTNPNNTVRNNVAADAQGNGFWLSYPEKPVKQGKNVPIRPQNIPHAPFEFNSARSNGNLGFMLECAMFNDAGDTTLLYYMPTVDGKPFDYTNGAGPVIRNITSAKNNGGYLNRVIKPSYEQWVSADNLGRAFNGAVQSGSALKHSLVIGKSLNDRQAYPTDAEPQLAVASYHSQMDITQNVFMNFKNAGSRVNSGDGDLASGVFGTNDYYICPLEKGFKRNPNNRLINADPGFRVKPPHIQAGYTAASSNDNWTLAGAIWDPNGYWDAPGRYWVLDSDFLRAPDCTAIASKAPTNLANGLSCAGPYYGVKDFRLGRGSPLEYTDQYSFLETMVATRLDTSDKAIGTWRIERGDTSRMLGLMRHFVAFKGGTYTLRFPEYPNNVTPKTSPKWINFSIDNVINAGDSFVMGIQYDGTATPRKVHLSPGDSGGFDANHTRVMTSVDSRALVASGDGTKFWQDKANNMVWVKITPYTGNFWAGVEANSDADLYRVMALRIE